MEGGRERDDFFFKILFFHCGVAKDKGSSFFLNMLKGDGREFFVFFSMLKRDDRGFIFYSFIGGGLGFVELIKSELK